MPEFIDYYAVLGVANAAPWDEIKTAYRKLALTYHPDHNPGNAEAEERFKDINEAYAALSSHQKRQTYNQLWENLRPGEKVVFSSGAGAGARPAGFSDFFNTLFGNNAGGVPKNSGENIRASQPGGEAPSCSVTSFELHISLEEAMRGSRQKLSVCCQSVCPACAGLGRVRDAYCPQCRGAGQLVRLTKAEVNLPKGFRHGASISLNSPNCASPSGENGEHYLKIYISPHPDFKVSGDDLETEVWLAAGEADIADEVTVPALDGVFNLKLPRHWSSGEKLLVPGRGLYKKDGTRGDLCVVIGLEEHRPRYR